MKQQHCQIYPTDIANTVARSSILLTLLVIIQLSLFISQIFGMFESLTKFAGLDLNGLICQHYVLSEINSIFIFIQQGCQI